jgi:N-acetylglucosaminyldiphosphoundecaprenol N-acetyl-beta-D-mannosaminyltransferase
MNKQSALMSTTILGTRIHAVTVNQVISCICHWAHKQQSTIVCFCNVHSLVSAQSDPLLYGALSKADLALPDGAPIAWIMRRRLWPDQVRLNGPDVMWMLLAEAAKQKLSIYLFGSTTETLVLLIQNIKTAFPLLMIAGFSSPPYTIGAIDLARAASDAKRINQSGAQLVFVGLGCPKQEKWMALQYKQINAVMLGVGAAFDYHAGTLQRAPLSWQHYGLEWLYRITQEPYRLIPRYVITNSIFLFKLIGEIRKKPHQKK